jgi:hypothetical protein
MTLNDIDIGGLTYAELHELRQMAELRMEELREQGVPALRERFAEEAAALGVTLDEVVGAVKRKPGRPRKPRPAEEPEQLSTSV